MILFTQSTAVLHKYFNDKLKILCLLQFSPEVAQNSLSFPCSDSEKSLSIPGFPGLWFSRFVATLCFYTERYNTLQVFAIQAGLVSIQISSTELLSQAKFLHHWAPQHSFSLVAALMLTPSPLKQLSYAYFYKIWLKFCNTFQ